MFKKLRKAFTLIELIVVMVVIALITIFIGLDYSKPTLQSKIESTSSIFKDYHLIISLNSNFSEYTKLMEKVNAVSDNDEDMLDELIQIGVVSSHFPKEMFEEPEKVVVEIRTIKVDGYKRLIYLYTDSTNERDKYILDEAIKKLNFVNQI